MTEKHGTFLVTSADEGSAVLRDVADGQIHALSENPGVAERDVLEATVAPEPPLEVAWSVVEIEDERRIPVEATDLEPTRQALDVATEQSVGDVARRERAGEGQLHVITVPTGEADDAVADVLDDEETVARAARLGMTRVEVRSAEGVVSVRYLPD